MESHDTDPANIVTDRTVHSEVHEEYWKWDSWKWGTHRVNCYPGSCPFRVYVKDGKVVREELSCTYPEFEDPDHKVPDYNPRGCQKGLQHSKAMYGADRILHPMKRKGERGSGQWEQLSWDQAFDEIGAKLAEIIVEHGPEALIDAYTRFFYHYTDAPLLIVNAAEINFVDSDADFQALLDHIASVRTGGRHFFNPLPVSL